MFLYFLNSSKNYLLLELAKSFDIFNFSSILSFALGTVIRLGTNWVQRDANANLNLIVGEISSPQYIFHDIYGNSIIPGKHFIRKNTALVPLE